MSHALSQTGPLGACARLFAIVVVAAAFTGRAIAVEETLVVASSTTSRSASADYVCDGSADDVEIQSAVNALPAAGGTVYLTDGIFNLSANIDLGNKTGVKLLGAGPGTILKMASGANASAIRGGTVLNITLADFSIDGNNANNTSGKGLQFLTSTGKGVKAERLYIYDCVDAAIGLTCDEVSILNCELHDCGAGVQINSGAEKCYVIGSRIYNVALLAGQLSDGISCQGARCRFEANVIWNNSDTGINIASATNEGRNVAIGNEIYLNGNSGINTGGADHDVIMGNICYANGRKTATPRSNAGIYVRDRTDGTQTSEDCVIVGNRCYEDTTDFPLPTGAVGQLYELALHKNTGSAPLNNIAMGNDFRGNLTSGIFRENVGTGNVLQENLGDTTYANGTATITSAATSVVVTHGLTSTPTVAGISVTPTSNLTSATKFWVSNVTATQFTINVNVAPGASVSFSWQAQVYTEPTI